MALVKEKRDRRTDRRINNGQSDPYVAFGFAGKTKRKHIYQKKTQANLENCDPATTTTLILKLVKVTARCKLKELIKRIMHANFQCSIINTCEDMSQVTVFVVDRRTNEF